LVRWRPSKGFSVADVVSSPTLEMVRARYARKFSAAGRATSGSELVAIVVDEMLKLDPSPGLVATYKHCRLG